MDHLKTSQNIYGSSKNTYDHLKTSMEHLKSSDIILRTTEIPSYIVQFSLNKKISTLQPKSHGVDRVVISDLTNS